MITVPRSLITGFTGLLSAYVIVTAGVSLLQGEILNPSRVAAAVALYAIATLAVLVPGRSLTVPLWAASVALGVSLAVMILVASAVDPVQARGNGHTTWYVAGIGTLMTGVVIRRRPLFAWSGIGALAVHTVFWASPEALLDFGVTGAAAAVGAAHLLTAALARADRDAEHFLLVEREAAQWHAAEEARLTERDRRIEATSRAAIPLLRRIVAAGGQLTDAERVEAIHLEAAIRDEIRGRRLLDDAVRGAVQRARERGVEVTLLDEGGIDDLADGELARIHAEIARALDDTDADNVVVRTAAESSDTAVTMVGLRRRSDAARFLGRDAEDEIALWREVPRSQSPVRAGAERREARAEHPARLSPEIGSDR